MTNNGNKGNIPKNQPQVKPAVAQNAVASNEKNAVDNVVPIAKTSPKEKSDISSNIAEASEKFAQTINMASRVLNESFSIGKTQIEACVEASGIVAQCAQNISESIYESANNAISENAECLKDLFNCQNASDLIALQNRISEMNMKMFFNNQTKVSNMMFEMSEKSSGPFTDSMSDCSDRMNKLFK